jgi:hypothetical protein
MDSFEVFEFYQCLVILWILKKPQVLAFEIFQNKKPPISWKPQGTNNFYEKIGKKLFFG